MDKNFFYKIKNKIKNYMDWLINGKLKKLTNKQKIIMISLILLVIISTSFLIISVNSSKMRTIDKIEKILDSKEPYDIYKYIKSKDLSLKVNEKTIKPLVDYLKDNPERKKEIINALRYDNSSTGLLNLKSEKGFIGKKYYVELSPVSLSININLSNTKLYLNEEEIHETKEDDTKFNMESLLPGKYDLKSVYENEYGEISDLKNITLIQNQNNVDVKLQGVRLSIDSNYKDSKVFINGENTNKTVDEFKDIGPIPSDESYKVHIEKDFPWGLVKSDDKAIGASSIIKLELNPLTNELRTKLELIYQEFYNNLFKALTDGKKEEIANTSSEIRNELYKKYYENGLIIRNSYEMKELKWQLDNISMKFEDGKYKTYAIAEISYQKEKNIIFIPYDKETVNKSFMTELTYNENDKTWSITKVEEV